VTGHSRRDLVGTDLTIVHFMLTLYGISSSRASRCMWMLNELNLDYKHVSVNDHNGETRSPEFMLLNPNGKVPLLVDGEHSVFESIAINLHLANKYQSKLWFDDVDMQGQVTQWSIWAMMEVDENIMHVLSAKEEAEAQRHFSVLLASVKVLDDFLSQRQYLIKEQFSVADLNTAACFSGGAFMRYNFNEFTHLSRWLKMCYSRTDAAIEGSSLIRFRDLLN
jgi:glutathione S-transferase